MEDQIYYLAQEKVREAESSPTKRENMKKNGLGTDDGRKPDGHRPLHAGGRRGLEVRKPAL